VQFGTRLVWCWDTLAAAPMNHAGQLQLRGENQSRTLHYISISFDPHRGRVGNDLRHDHDALVMRRAAPISELPVKHLRLAIRYIENLIQNAGLAGGPAGGAE